MQKPDTGILGHMVWLAKMSDSRSQLGFGMAGLLTSDFTSLVNRSKSS